MAKEDRCGHNDASAALKLFARWQHRFDVDSNFYPCSDLAQNVVSSSVGGSDYPPSPDFIGICSVFVWSE